MRILVVLSLVLMASLAGCLGGKVTPAAGLKTDEPSYENIQPVTAMALEHVAQLVDENGEPLPTAAGIWVFGDYAFSSARGSRFYITDISNPAEPTLVYWAPEDALTPFARDADLIAHSNGRRTLVLATQSDGLHLWDVTDPSKPVFASRTEVNPNHNVAVIPGTSYIFNSQSGGAGGTNEIIDASNPEKARVAGEMGDHGCHDITFFGKLGDPKFRAYCAGIQRTEIWDMDGFNPKEVNFGIKVIATIDGGTPESPVVGSPITASYPVRTLHHLAMVNEAGTILIVGDEHNGGGSPGACFVNDPTTNLSTPLGALWFYDISSETAPALLSWISPPLVAPSIPPALNPAATDPTNPGGVLNNVPNCTAHFGTLVPGEEKIVMAWYSAGVLLIDFSNPSSPEILDQEILPGTNPWDAKVHDGYVFTGDIGRGLDVFKLV